MTEPKAFLRTNFTYKINHEIKSFRLELPEQNVPTSGPVACRICWGEEDDDEGGEFIAPCNCTGTSRYVHTRCLKRWIGAVASNKGISAATRCDVCRSSYTRLPPSLVVKEQLHDWLKREALEIYQRANRSPYAALLHSLINSAWIYSAGVGLYAAFRQFVEIPSVLVQARTDPINALRPLAPKFIAALLLEPLLSSPSDWWFHIETAIFYAFGWALDAGARTLRSIALPRIETLPKYAQFGLEFLLGVPLSIGICFQALDLTLMSLYGGGVVGFFQGALESIAAPFKALSVAAKCGAGFLGVLAMAAAKVAAKLTAGGGAAAAAQTR